MRKNRQPPMLFNLGSLVLYSVICAASQSKINRLQLYFATLSTSTMAPNNFGLGAIFEVGQKKPDNMYRRKARLKKSLLVPCPIISSNCVSVAPSKSVNRVFCSSVTDVGISTPIIAPKIYQLSYSKRHTNDK